MDTSLQCVASNLKFLAKVGCHNSVDALMCRFAGKQVSSWHLKRYGKDEHSQLLRCLDDAHKLRSEPWMQVARTSMREKGRTEWRRNS